MTHENGTEQSPVGEDRHKNNDGQQNEQWHTESSSSPTDSTQSGQQSSMTSSSTTQPSGNSESGGCPEDRTGAGQNKPSSGDLTGSTNHRDKTAGRSPSRKQSAAPTNRNHPPECDEPFREILPDGGTQSVSTEVRINSDRKELAQKAGVTKDSAAIVESEVRNGDLYVTVSGHRNPMETAHRLPDELTVRQCLDCGESYDSSARICPECGSEETEFSVRSRDMDTEEDRNV